MKLDEKQKNIAKCMLAFNSAKNDEKSHYESQTKQAIISYFNTLDTDMFIYPKRRYG